ncbi:MAG: hypothetical protein GY710_08570, partial [Desulfobacteraceae bacterium]|nr:hypothetical protein [Desulfobacteraceae bacterium]
TASLSITPKKKLWQCFGCGESGDMISFIQRKEGCSFPEAAKKLADLENVSEDSLIVTETKKPLSISSTVQYLDLKIEKEKDNTPAPVKSNPSPFTDSEILSKVTGYYHQTFLTKSEGKTYLKSRGITKESIITDYKPGYCNGTLLHVIPKDERICEQLIRLGVLLESKKERFINCVIFPITDENRMYGRHIHMKEGGHFYLPGARSGLFNETYLKTEKPAELVITESIIDALSFMERGILNVLPIYGINGFTKAHETLLIELKPCRLIIALDGDEQGKQAAE